MTIEELIGCNPAELEKMSDEQFLTFAKEAGWLDITRPELAVKENHKTIRVNEVKQSKKDKARHIAAQYGLTLDI